MSLMKLTLLFFLLFLTIACNNEISKKAKTYELDYPDNLKIIERSEWGWIPIDTVTRSHEIKYITVHHGGVEFTAEKNPLESVRELQTWSRKEKNWVDIPYHFMIDLEGNIYETRPINIPGDTNTEYDPTSHALIEVMGNYEIQIPNENQISSLVALSNFLMNYFNVQVNNVKAHRDYSNKTVCPGKNLYEYFANGYIEKALLEK